MVTLRLEDCFVGLAAGEGFVWLDGQADRIASPTRGRHVAMLIRLDAPSRLRRLVGWLTMPLRVARAERRVVRTGATPVGRFGVWPDTQKPTFVWHLEGPASSYADAQLLPEVSAPLRWLRRVGSRFHLCHPSVAAVIVIGTVR